MDRSNWINFIEEFRSFGGKAENVIQRKGPFGLGLFAINPQCPININVPNHLLVSAENIELHDGNAVIKRGRDYPTGYPDWFRRYQASYSWGAEGETSVTKFEKNLLSLPESVLKLLKKYGLYSHDRLTSDSDFRHTMLQQFLRSRCIGRQGRLYVMPIAELVNHSANARSWVTGSDGSIGVLGVHKNEILVKYSNTDSLRRLMTYGFNSVEPICFSLPVRVLHRGQEITISGLGKRVWSRPPLIRMTQHGLVMEKPLLGHRNIPKLPKTLFVEACKEHCDIVGNELFDQVCQSNTVALVNILQTLKISKAPIARQLAQGCIDQLDSLSFRTGQLERPFKMP